MATIVTDNFIRANDPTSPGPNYTVEVFPPGDTNGIQLLSNAFAPTSGAQTAFPTAFGIWNANTFGPNQFCQVEIASIAPEQSLVAITAASFSGGNTTYTYTLTGGAALQNPQGIIVNGMTNPGNDGAFVITGLGAGTFTVANASGVTEAGSSGTGDSATDSLCGPVVRGSLTTLDNYFIYIGNNSGYVAKADGTNDTRVYVHEFWKFFGGTPSDLLQIQTAVTIPDTVGDIFTLFALESKICLYKNQQVIAVVVDTDVTSGAPGIMTSSCQGAGITVTPIGANVGVDGMSMTNFVGSDAPSTPSGWTKQWTETFADNSTAAGYGAWPGFSGALSWGIGGGNSGESGFFNKSMLVTQRMWANDQAAMCVMSNTLGNTSQSLLLRATTAAETGYLIQFVFTNGDGAGALNIDKFVGGTFSNLATSSSATLGFSDTFRAEIVGNVITVKINGTTVLTATDSSSPIVSGVPAMGPGGGATFVMFWEGDEAIPAPPPTSTAPVICIMC